MTIALIVALFTLAVFVTPKKTSVKPEVVARFQAMTPGVTVVNRDCGLYPVVEDIVDITDEVEMIPDATDAIVDKLLEGLGDDDGEIEEIKAAQRELRSRLIALRSRKEMFKRVSN